MSLQTLATISSCFLLTNGVFVFALSRPVLTNHRARDSPLTNTQTRGEDRQAIEWASPTASSHSSSNTTETHAPDLSGTWEIQEEDKTYRAMLDAQGNGPYTHEGGRFTTTKLDGRLWSGKWIQTENDREGEFEVLLSEDFLTAEGDWWYLRVGEDLSIPPRLHGGSYFFRRLPERTSLYAPQRP